MFRKKLRDAEGRLLTVIHTLEGKERERVAKLLAASRQLHGEAMKIENEVLAVLRHVVDCCDLKRDDVYFDFDHLAFLQKPKETTTSTAAEEPGKASPSFVVSKRPD